MQLVQDGFEGLYGQGLIGTELLFERSMCSLEMLEPGHRPEILGQNESLTVGIFIPPI